MYHKSIKLSLLEKFVIFRPFHKPCNCQLLGIYQLTCYNNLIRFAPLLTLNTLSCGTYRVMVNHALYEKLPNCGYNFNITQLDWYTKSSYSKCDPVCKKQSYSLPKLSILTNHNPSHFQPITFILYQNIQPC